MHNFKNKLIMRAIGAVFLQSNMDQSGMQEKYAVLKDDPELKVSTSAELPG